jgi:hypothetical protein
MGAERRTAGVAAGFGRRTADAEGVPRAQKGAEEAMATLAPHQPAAGRSETGIHCVRTHWIRGFMTFRRVRHARTVMLMVSA